LHTNDAAGAVARLLDLGIEPYLWRIPCWPLGLSAWCA